jgi:adenylate cyclase
MWTARSPIPALPPGAIPLRQLDRIRVAARDGPVKIHELLARRGGTGELDELVSTFAEARAAYVGREWNRALQLFSELLRRWPDDGPSRVFLLRSQQFMVKEPPPDWDGVHVTAHK